MLSWSTFSLFHRLSLLLREQELMTHSFFLSEVKQPASVSGIPSMGCTSRNQNTLPKGSVCWEQIIHFVLLHEGRTRCPGCSPTNLFEVPPQNATLVVAAVVGLYFQMAFLRTVTAEVMRSLNHKEIAATDHEG